MAERTFWDKVIILHGARCWFEKRGVLRQEGQRVSRHYYDVHRMMHSAVAARALSDLELAGDCVRHARLFFGSPDLGLELARPGGFALIPTAGMLDNLRRDYDRMQGRIVGDAPKFADVMNSIQDLESQINGTQP